MLAGLCLLLAVAALGLAVTVEMQRQQLQASTLPAAGSRVPKDSPVAATAEPVVLPQSDANSPKPIASPSRTSSPALLIAQTTVPTTPPPLVIESVNAAGGISKRRIFETLLGSEGQPLAKQAEFSRTLGRRLFFHVPKGPPIAFDVDQLHPDALHYLGYTAGQLKDEQIEMDRQRELASERAEKDRQARLEAQRERALLWEKARAERAAAQPAITGDQLVSLAAMQAASQRAPAPPTVIVVQQPQPQPTWNWPVQYVPLPHYPVPTPTPAPLPVVTRPPIPAGSSFRFIQQDNPYDPFAFGRRL